MKEKHVANFIAFFSYKLQSSVLKRTLACSVMTVAIVFNLVHCCAPCLLRSVPLAICELSKFKPPEENWILIASCQRRRRRGVQAVIGLTPERSHGRLEEQTQQVLSFASDMLLTISEEQSVDFLV